MKTERYQYSNNILQTVCFILLCIIILALAVINVRQINMSKDIKSIKAEQKK